MLIIVLLSGTYNNSIHKRRQVMGGGQFIPNLVWVSMDFCRVNHLRSHLVLMPLMCRKLEYVDAFLSSMLRSGIR